MKKNLLLIAVAMFMAVGASAQKQNLSVCKKAIPEAAKMETTSPVSASSKVLSFAKVAKRAASNSIAGEYIMSYYTTYKKEFKTSNTFTITNETGQIELFAETGNTPEKFDYNVKLTGFTYDKAVAYGKYDSETDILTVPAQTIYTHDTYGRVVLFAVSEEEGKLKNLYGAIEFEVGDEGLSLVTETEGTDEICGFYNQLVDPGDAEGEAWNFGFDPEVFVPNAVLDYRTTGKAMGGNGTDWAKVTKSAYIEDWGSSATIHNFIGLAPVSVNVDAEGAKVAIQYGQQMDDYDYNTVDEKDPTDYGFMKLVGCAIDGKSIMRDYNAKALNGFIVKDGYEFYKTEYKDAWTDESGDHEAGDYMSDDDPNYIRYFAVATNAGEGGAYSMGWCCNMKVYIYSMISEGIGEIKSDANVGNRAIYNLMGQKVNSSAKGLVIRDGKKFIVK